MGQNGGSRPGSGRKPKVDEIAMIELLSPMDKVALNALKKGLEAGDFPYVKMFMEYRYGKPKEKIEHSGQLGVLWNELRNYEPDEEANKGTGLSGGQPDY